MSTEENFWRAGASLLERDDVSRSTMMGLPCLRVSQKFFAAFDRATGNLLVKLPAAQVDHLIATGQAGTVAPAGRRFREWASISSADVARWPSYLTEACAFVAERV